DYANVSFLGASEHGLASGGHECAEPRLLSELEHDGEQCAVWVPHSSKRDAYRTTFDESEVLMRKSILCLFLVLIFACSMVAIQNPQSPTTPPTFRVNTQLVIQTVSVTGKDGKPMEGLTADDFILTEDNVTQTISVFEFEKRHDTLIPRSAGPTPREGGLNAVRGQVQLSDQNQIAP